ncbi:phosphatidylethanolamine-binding protein 2 isoform X2 [Bemisia tabaci]|uniref:phosphatidylethanolamine-binding protein 2 isoform X2 n=1 Tax=Bemisia tabaci TaxID=7038 RepID=UPI003B289844
MCQHGHCINGKRDTCSSNRPWKPQCKKMHLIQSYGLFPCITQWVIQFLGVSCYDFLNYGTPPPELSAEAIKDALIKHEIYKDLGYVNYPKHMLQVNYEVHHLQLGTRVPDYLAIIPPDGINYTHYDKLGHYALLVVGLDVPTREKPSHRSYRHMTLANIPEDRFLSAECLVKYEWMDAPYEIGLHRVVFLLFKQEGEKPIVYDESSLKRREIDKLRSNFSAIKFSSKYNLGDPVAVNFFFTQIDENHIEEH